MSVEGVPATAVAAAAAGALLIYSGIKGKRVSDAFRAVLSGQTPATLPNAYGIAGNFDATSTGNTAGGTGSATFSGSSSSIATYAASFAGKLPYVWGGTSLTTGCDCSGFTQSVYAHYGISAPRTSEAQGAWVSRTSTPTPGGLAFYHSPPGGPDPGHVAVIATATTVISQGGGLGPQIENLNFLPLLWTGVPP